MIRRLKNFFKNKFLFNLFYYGQFLGIDILPRHFYSEIPSIHKLKKEKEWRKPFTMIGLKGAELETQLDFVAGTVRAAGHDSGKVHDIYAAACDDNGEPGYGPIEAQFLYSFVVARKPSKIIQVGCGVTTAICLRAAQEAGYKPEITCVDPFPSEFLKKSASDNLITLVEEPFQNTEFSILEPLSDGDMFFVDSTHCLGPAGEVTRLILEYLPRLNKGVYIHFHDILFPYDYSGELLSRTLFFQHETALLHAFLACIPKYEIMASLSMLHYERLDELKDLFADYNPRLSDYGLTKKPGDYPSSIYLRVVE